MSVCAFPTFRHIPTPQLFIYSFNPSFIFILWEIHFVLRDVGFNYRIPYLYTNSVDDLTSQ